jgi:hypothetical protein
MSDFDDQHSMPLSPFLDEPGSDPDTDEDTVEITDLEPGTRSPGLHPPDALRQLLLPRLPYPLSRITAHRLNITLRIAVVLSIALLIVLVLPNSITTLENIGGRAISSVLPLSAPVGYNQFYVEPTVAGLHVLIDNRSVSLPRIGIDAPLTFAPGNHIITWLGTPFQTQACTLSIPTLKGDTCTFAYENIRYHSVAYPVILLNESLTSLSPQESKMLVQAMNNALGQIAATAPVQPGELLTGENGPVPAPEPLQATLQFSFDSAQGGVCPDYTALLAEQGIPCQIEGQSCLLLCPVPWQSQPSVGYLYRMQYPAQYPADTSSLAWFAFAITDTHWNYATLSGQLFGSVEPLGAEGSLLDKQLLLFAISWNGSWHVDVLPSSTLYRPIYVTIKVVRGVTHPVTTLERILLSDDPACTTAIGYIRNGLTTSGAVPTSQQVHVQLFSALNPALGCLVEAGSGGDTPQASANVASYLVRFGVLLSANTQAHLLRPELPYADAYALQIEQQLQQLPGQNIVLSIGT